MTALGKYEIDNKPVALANWAAWGAPKRPRCKQG